MSNEIGFLIPSHLPSSIPLLLLCFLSARKYVLFDRNQTFDYVQYVYANGEEGWKHLKGHLSGTVKKVLEVGVKERPQVGYGPWPRGTIKEERGCWKGTAESLRLKVSWEDYSLLYRVQDII